jgi:hypothetical protein
LNLFHLSAFHSLSEIIHDDGLGMGRHVNELKELFRDNFRDAHVHDHGRGYIYVLSSLFPRVCDDVHAHGCIICVHAIFIHYDYALSRPHDHYGYDCKTHDHAREPFIHFKVMFVCGGRVNNCDVLLHASRCAKHSLCTNYTIVQR